MANSDLDKATAELERGARGLADTTARAAAGAAEDAGIIKPREDLGDNAGDRRMLRREADKADFKLAVGDLAEGLRGLIRVAPLTSAFFAVAIGMTLANRRSRPKPPPRPRR